MSLGARLRSRAATWARVRQGEDAVPVALNARRVYILPTRFGVGAGFVLLVMVVAGLNYGNSVALLLAFLLTGYVLIGMYETTRSLLGLRLVHLEAQECFAGERARLELRFDNPASRTRCALALAADSGTAVRFELPGRTIAGVHAEVSASRRGRVPIERLRLSSTAPLGLFRAWAWLHPGMQLLVYPRPHGSLPLPLSGGERPLDANATAAVGEEEWAYLRPFHPGDSPRSVAWKQYARGAPLLVSRYEGISGTRRLLDYSALEGLAPEARLSQLTRWVLECERRAENYRLQLPGSCLDYGRGLHQRRAALCALALYGESGTDH